MHAQSHRATQHLNMPEAPSLHAQEQPPEGGAAKESCRSSACSGQVVPQLHSGPSMPVSGAFQCINAALQGTPRQCYAALQSKQATNERPPPYKHQCTAVHAPLQEHMNHRAAAMHDGDGVVCWACTQMHGHRQMTSAHNVHPRAL